MRVILKDYNTNTITWLKRNDEVAIPSYNNFFLKFFKKKKIPKPNDNTMNKYPIILRIVLHISTIIVNNCRKLKYNSHPKQNTHPISLIYCYLTYISLV